MKKFCLILASALSGLLHVEAVSSSEIDSIRDMIQAGAIGESFKDRSAQVTIRRIQNEAIPYRLFVFSDYTGEHTVMIHEDKLILLCSGFGGGEATEMTIIKIDGKETLTYSYVTGSGISIKLYGRYVLGESYATFGLTEP